MTTSPAAACLYSAQATRRDAGGVGVVAQQRLTGRVVGRCYDEVGAGAELGELVAEFADRGHQRPHIGCRVDASGQLADRFDLRACRCEPPRTLSG